jgi:subtilisin family serine protease
MIRPHPALLLLTFALSVPAHAAPARMERAAALTSASPRSVAVSPAILVALDAVPGMRAVPADARVDQVLARHGLDRGTPLGRDARFLRLVSTRSDFDAEAAAAELRATGRFRAVVAERSLTLHATIPNDTYLTSKEWFIQSPRDADLDLPEAWDIEKGSAATLIGVMDSGVDLGHPDLVGKIWTNPGEIPGNGIDDDGNGFIDDVNGWSFADSTAHVNPGPTIDPASGVDIGFHGTFVSGLAAAANNNAKGIAGAGWNCKILPIKVVRSDGGIALSAVTQAFEYAAQESVKVLNISFGGRGPGLPEYFQALVDMANAANVLVVASAGNDGLDSLTYPAACAHVVAVGAIDSTGARSDFSNRGTWVDVCAPGELMWSSICRNYTFDGIQQFIYIFLFNWDGVNPYMNGDGTSFSAPLVAGVAGLIRSHYPPLTPDQVAARLVATGDLVSPSDSIGPRVNAYRAVTEGLLGVPAAGAPVLALANAAPNPFRSRTGLTFTLGAAGHARLTIHDCAGRTVRSLVDADLLAGENRVTWDGRSEDGRTLANGLYFVRLEVGGKLLTRKLALIR